MPLQYFLPLPTLPLSLPSKPNFYLTPCMHMHMHSTLSLRPTKAIGSDGKFHPDPSDNDPPEAPEDTSRQTQMKLKFARAKQAQAREFVEKNQGVFLNAIKDVHDAPDDDDDDDDIDLSIYSNVKKVSKNGNVDGNDGIDDELFGDVDVAIANQRKEFVKQGLLEPNPPRNGYSKKVSNFSGGSEKDENFSGGEGSGEGMEDGFVKEGEGGDEEDELGEEEVADLEEIKELAGKVVEGGGERGEIDEEGSEEGDEGEGEDGLDDDFDMGFGDKKGIRIVDPQFRMTMAELLDESRVVPVSVFGDLEVELLGIEHDFRMVKPGDLFVLCVGRGEGEGEGEGEVDVGAILTEADKRGAAVIVVSKDVDIEVKLACQALVIVEDTSEVLTVLGAAFFGFPTRDMAVIGVTGTHGKTTVAYLVKAIYEAMGLRTGLISAVDYFVHGDNRLEKPEGSPDPVVVQRSMAKMLHNGSEAVVMEASASDLAHGRCEEVDFDIAVFKDLIRDHSNFQGSEEEYKVAQGKLFSRMVDPERHRKIVNIDDPNAPYFIALGNPDVPVLTFSMENKDAHVYPLKFELSLFETTVLVKTPLGILEISSGLLGRPNISNILAAVAVGLAVGAPLEDIVRGIEEVDAVPGRFELIDQEQAFGVIVDHARTPDELSRLLDYVKELKPKRIITVIGCHGERERGNRPWVTKIVTEKSDVTMLTSDNPGKEDELNILDDMLAGVGWSMLDYLNHMGNDYSPPLPNGHRLFVYDIREAAVRMAVAMGEEGDVVVIAGRGHETHMIVGDEKELVDDREGCRDALNNVHVLHKSGIDTSELPWRFAQSY